MVPRDDGRREVFILMGVTGVFDYLFGILVTGIS
jgi:hypothetical protein